MNYIVTREELLALAKTVYEEGACGFADLKENFCESAVEIFLQDKKEQTNTHISLTTTPISLSNVQYFNTEVAFNSQFGISNITSS